MEANCVSAIYPKLQIGSWRNAGGAQYVDEELRSLLVIKPTESLLSLEAS
jgi:hypothetical protein